MYITYRSVFLLLLKKRKKDINTFSILGEK